MSSVPRQLGWHNWGEESTVLLSRLGREVRRNLGPDDGGHGPRGGDRVDRWPALASGNDYPWASENLPLNPATYTWTNAAGNDLSPLRFAYRNCTDYAAWEINEELGVTSAAGRTNSPGAILNSAATVMLWTGSKVPLCTMAQARSTRYRRRVRSPGGQRSRHSFGHVAMVASVSNSGSTIVIDEYNALVVGGYTPALTYNPLLVRPALTALLARCLHPDTWHGKPRGNPAPGPPCSYRCQCLLGGGSAPQMLWR